jgi:hypothetical protein
MPHLVKSFKYLSTAVLNYDATLQLPLAITELPNNMFFASRALVSEEDPNGIAFLSTCSLSPVNDELSTRSSEEEKTTQSAGTLSPTFKTITSPTTSSDAGTLIRTPFLITSVFKGIISYETMSILSSPYV